MDTIWAVDLISQWVRCSGNDLALQLGSPQSLCSTLPALMRLCPKVSLSIRGFCLVNFCCFVSAKKKKKSHAGSTCQVSKINSSITEGTWLSTGKLEIHFHNIILIACSNKGFYFLGCLWEWTFWIVWWLHVFHCLGDASCRKERKAREDGHISGKSLGWLPSVGSWLCTRKNSKASHGKAKEGSLREIHTL